MSSIFFSGEKAPREEAIKELMNQLIEHTDDRYWVRFESDDTSNHITAIIETVHSSDTIKFKLKKPLPPKFMGHRLIVKLVPINYIEHILLAKEKDYD